MRHGAGRTGARPSVACRYRLREHLRAVVSGSSAACLLPNDRGIGAGHRAMALLPDREPVPRGRGGPRLPTPQPAPGARPARRPPAPAATDSPDAPERRAVGRAPADWPPAPGRPWGRRGPRWPLATSAARRDERVADGAPGAADPPILPGHGCHFHTDSRRCSVADACRRLVVDRRPTPGLVGLLAATMVAERSRTKYGSCPCEE